jgi:hypothetical protein
LSRQRDKDKLLGPSTYVWDVAEKAYRLVPRELKVSLGPFFAYTDLPEKQGLLLKWLVDRARVTDGFPCLNTAFLETHLVPRLMRTHRVSLRLLDWLVVDYAREKGVAYKHVFPGCCAPRVVVVHMEYSQWLARWKRRHYDVFRRRHRVYFKVGEETHSTTVAQLHFFYMAEMYGFLRYAEDNVEAIEAHMKEKLDSNAISKALAKSEGRRFQRKPLVGKSTPSAYVVTHGAVKVHLGADGDGDGDDDDDFDDDVDKDDDVEKDDDVDKDSGQAAVVQAAVVQAAVVQAAVVQAAVVQAAVVQAAVVQAPPVFPHLEDLCGGHHDDAGFHGMMDTPSGPREGAFTIPRCDSAFSGLEDVADLSPEDLVILSGVWDPSAALEGDLEHDPASVKVYE